MVVCGLLVIGMVHVVLEVRYVSGRYHGLLRGRFLVGVNVVLVAIVVSRLLLPGVVPRRVEIVVLLGTPAGGAGDRHAAPFARVAPVNHPQANVPGP